MTERAVVTGAAGFIGSHLVDILLEKGYFVIGIDNLRTGNLKNLTHALNHENFQFLERDVCEIKFPTAVKEDIDVIYHLAAISSVKLSVEDPILVNDTNVQGTINTLEMARKCNARRFVYSSSAAVYGDPSNLPVAEDSPLIPLSPYAASKISAEMYCISYGSLYGISPTILRYFNVFGPRQENSEYSGVISIFINQGLRNQDITVDGDGTHTRSFIYVDDVVRATQISSQLENASGQILNMSGADSISILNLAHMIKERIPDSSSNIIHRDAREGDVKDSIGSMKKTSNILGFSPAVSLTTGLDRTISWYREHSL